MRRLVLGASCILLACGDTGSAGGGGVGGVDDGKLHPDGNGVEVDETTACNRLHDAVLDKANELACVATVATCNAFISSLSGEACAMYDDGSVDGCVGYYDAAADCADLTARSDGCVPLTLGSPGCTE